MTPKCPFPWGSGPHLWFLGPTRAQFPNGNQIGLSVFAVFAVVTNRQRHRPRYIGNNRPHLLLSIAMRQNYNKSWWHRPCCLQLQIIWEFQMLFLAKWHQDVHGGESAAICQYHGCNIWHPRCFVVATHNTAVFLKAAVYRTALQVLRLLLML